MSDLLIIERELPPDMMERSGDGWTVAGIVVPFEQVREVSDDGISRYREVFDRTSFDRDISNGGDWVNLYHGHHGNLGERWLGRCSALRAESVGLWAEFRINRKHPRADEARHGELTRWSVGARVYKLRRDGEVRRYLACGLDHVAATATPQYAEAGVTVVRDETVDETPGTPRLDASRRRLRALQSFAESRHPGT